MSYQHIRIEARGNVALISLVDPATLNAASLNMVKELDTALAEIPEKFRAIVLTGQGRGFCSGALLDKSLDPTKPGYDAGNALESHFNPLMRRIQQLPLPIVTAVNGAAAGFGASIALAGDLIIAAESAYFLQAFRHIGLVPDSGAASLLVHAAGRARAMEMMLLGERIGAVRAMEWGLVNRVVPNAELHDTALALATTLAAGPTLSLGLTRRLGWEAMTRGFSDMLALERAFQEDAGNSMDHREGIEAFFEKRPVVFKGK